jgi:hypothetical protein
MRSETLIIVAAMKTNAVFAMPLSQSLLTLLNAIVTKISENIKEMIIVVRMRYPKTSPAYFANSIS